MIRGAGCGNPTSPDLWGPRVGNHPGLPDPRFCIQNLENITNFFRGDPD
jgi:hypothetical protein